MVIGDECCVCCFFQVFLAFVCRFTMSVHPSRQNVPIPARREVHFVPHVSRGCVTDGHTDTHTDIEILIVRTSITRNTQCYVKLIGTFHTFSHWYFFSFRGGSPPDPPWKSIRCGRNILIALQIFIFNFGKRHEKPRCLYRSLLVHFQLLLSIHSLSLFWCYLYIPPLIIQHKAAHVKKLVWVDNYQSSWMSAPEIC